MRKKRVIGKPLSVASVIRILRYAVVEMLQTVGAGFLGRSPREPVMFEIQIVYLSIGIKEGVKYMSLEVRE